MTPIVRGLIGDFDSTDFSDARIQNLILISAAIIKNDAGFNTSYEVDVQASSITPDPTDEPDNDYITLVSLKSACLLYRSKIQSTGRSETVKDAWTSVSLGDNSKSIIESSKQICEQYEQARKNYLLGNSRAGKAVMGPIVNDSLYPRYGNFT